MKKIFYICIFLLQLALAACQEEVYINTESGKDACVSSLTFRLSDVLERDMVLSRADGNDGTQLNDMHLYIFADGQKVSDVDIPSTQIGSPIGGIYKISGSIEVKTGSNNVYAIANQSSDFYNKTKLALSDITSEEEFKKVFFSINSAYAENKSLPISVNTIFMTGFGEVTIVGTGDEAKATGTIVLKRPVASIIFTVHTTAENNGNKIEFIPQTYKVYNVVNEISVVDGVNEKNTNSTYYDTQEFTNWASIFDDNNNVVAKKCQFYVPENIQYPKENAKIGNYHDRDRRDLLTRAWTNAPDNGTYIVISGVYTEKTENSIVNQGTTSYTIHLGDFSNQKWNNFIVERNAIYSYTISVKGVDEIIAEAKKESDNQPGAEGEIIGNEVASEIFDLDCTYEQVLVSFDLNQIVESIRNDQSSVSGLDEKIANSFILKTSSPFDMSGSQYIRPYAVSQGISSDVNEIALKDKMDYKWIYFFSQESNSAFSRYPGIDEQRDGGNLIDPYNLCVKLGRLVRKLYNGEPIRNNDEGIKVTAGNKVYFTAFVDEYYYDKNPLDNSKSVSWADFTRQDDRSMTIASDMKISEDGHSIYAKARISITQRAIQTFYNADIAYNTNALGLETYCENEVFGNLANWYSAKNSTNGRENMLTAGFLGNRWEDYVNIAANGYLDDKKSLLHKIPNNSSLVSSKIDPFYACLSRNRDLNGDGNIEDNEIRWYLAASDQYARLQIGSSAMSDASRFFLGNKKSISANYPQNFYDDGALYINSTYSHPTSGVNKQVLWAAEVGAFGQFKTDHGHEVLLRCVRNLPSENVKAANPNSTVVDDKALADVSYDTDKGDYLFVFGNRLDPRIYRVTLQEQPYPPHFEEPSEDNMSDMNRLPKNGFKVAKNDIMGQWGHNPLTYDPQNIWNATVNPCANYNEAGANTGKWRVPNLREMMVLTTKAKQLGLTTGYYAISTGFSGQTQTRKGFAYDAGGGFVTTEFGENVKVRCVRDVQPNEIQ